MQITKIDTAIKNMLPASLTEALETVKKVAIIRVKKIPATIEKIFFLFVNLLTIFPS